ncbi:MAG: hypothetical protein JO324_04785, partial [Candidatus Eremiobacteraeota bacterium]|nr:hypothetical protein [Candidatus Eremiobacteraeota bacterium]
MNASNLPRRVMACVTIAMLAGCGGGGQQSAAPMLPRAAHRTSSASYQQLYQFHRQWGGTHATGGLVNVNGTLYGTTARGGASGNGTVYSMTTGGAHKVLYRFRGGSDGSDPHSQLLDVKGTLYGTTAGGGSANAGTVYSVTTSGAEKVLYAFKGGSDGAVPMAGLASINGVLYGTTSVGGGSGCSTSSSAGCGTVFSVTTGGEESVLHRFAGGSDGALPQAELLDVNGVLYGTTGIGGSCALSIGCGVVYSITPSGDEKVLYAFKGGSD